jgi:hypothetical protein
LVRSTRGRRAAADFLAAVFLGLTVGLRAVLDSDFAATGLLIERFDAGLFARFFTATLAAAFFRCCRSGFLAERPVVETRFLRTDLRAAMFVSLVARALITLTPAWRQ